MAHWILILLVWGSNNGDVATSTATFQDQAACVQAAAAIQKSWNERGLYPVCVPDSTHKE